VVSQSRDRIELAVLESPPWQACPNAGNRRIAEKKAGTIWIELW